MRCVSYFSFSDSLTFSSPQASFLQGCLALSVCQKAVFCSVSLCKHTLTWFLSFIWKCGFQMRLLPKPLEGWLDCLLTPALKFLTLNENVYYSSNKPQVMLTRLSRDHPLRTTIAYCVALFLLPSCSPIFMKCEVMMEDRWATTSYTEVILINTQML